MPKATISLEGQRYELQSLKGAYVLLRPLPYGKILERRDGASRMVMEQTRGQRADSRMIVEMAQEWSRWYEFKECIVEHNLEDDGGELLNFQVKANIYRLDPKVGQEIERLIDEMNMDIEEAEDLKNFIGSSTASSQDEKKSLKEVTPAT
ncbi:MAG: hypothetical protein UY48_C0055G0003 [Candidatus Gottesmanbacteria bacterium GW2011_GWB1_49_7]|uniref:Uncharacterized protein n=1 Tax=Candidatus Gottesmanbacteria bacterium GW2011_GWB1_49_7 TaxID=1618448 RepID=A0A0G1VTV3_9BACT|nr:MAG: hypothetical protein UY48_C0055G0003 [Candidatus Gottesmanbacteria bacterium GW2011_GWB1_49_7]